jgi:hypothetical protein
MEIVDQREDEIRVVAADLERGIGFTQTCL